MPTTPETPRLNARQFPATLPNTTDQALYVDADPFPNLHGVADEKREVMDITRGRMPIEALDLPSVDHRQQPTGL
ncbi:hypothetical protein ACLOAV_010417 [Pseudogymnoascus australis]